MSTDSTSDQGEPLTLCAIGVRDAKQLHALIYAPSMSHGDPQTPFHSVESTREWIEKRPPQHIEIGAWVGEQLIGHAQIEVGRTRRAHVGAIGVGVHGDRRRRGVATRLVGEVIDLATTGSACVGSNSRCSSTTMPPSRCIASPASRSKGGCVAIRCARASVSMRI
ncbi:GNAT family N-acetyltransferase [Paraburkholderia sp. JPY419]|uniref:GNAT family N-acetyltransferase n=1 Tax=Paraburkholderia sp. JPY419 TaxID=667660 RepID=UPI003D2589F5